MLELDDFDNIQMVKDENGNTVCLVPNEFVYKMIKLYGKSEVRAVESRNELFEILLDQHINLTKRVCELETTVDKLSVLLHENETSVSSEDNVHDNKINKSEV